MGLVLIIIIIIVLIIFLPGSNGQDENAFLGTSLLMNDENIENVDRIMYKMMKYIDEEFNKNDIKYVVDRGTLLGVEREGKRIVYDDDIDIIVDKNDWDKFRQIPKYPNEDYVYKYYYPLIHGKDIRKLYQRDKSKYSFIIADIQKSDYAPHPAFVFIWEKLLKRPNTIEKSDYLFDQPLRRMKFGPIEVWTPSSYNTDKRLIEMYGKDYMIPRR